MTGFPPRTSRWRRITSQGKTIYWYRRLGKDHYLAVKKVDGGWEWAERGPEFTREAGFVAVAAGAAPTMPAARRAADAHVEG